MPWRSILLGLIPQSQSCFCILYKWSFSPNCKCSTSVIRSVGGPKWLCQNTVSECFEHNFDVYSWGPVTSLVFRSTTVLRPDPEVRRSAAGRSRPSTSRPSWDDHHHRRCRVQTTRFRDRAGRRFVQCQLLVWCQRWLETSKQLLGSTSDARTFFFPQAHLTSKC